MKRDEFIANVCHETARAFGIETEEMAQRSNRFRVAYPRGVAMTLLYSFSDMSYPEIAALFGFDHTTALYWRKKIDDELLIYSDIQKKVKWIIAKLESRGVIKRIGNQILSTVD